MSELPLPNHPPPLRSALLETIPGVSHAITSRVTGLGQADGNLAYSAPRDRADAWTMRRHWCRQSGLAAARLVTLGQVHGTDVQRAAASHAGWGALPGSTQIGLGDALATDAPGPVLMTLHADCQPILVVDPGRGRRGPAIAVAHAGWRGAVAGIASRTVGFMTQAFGSRAADLHVYLGPAIGSCCYEVGNDVVHAWENQAGAEAGTALQRGPRRSRFSLTAANMLLLERAGVLPAHIEASPICTCCQGEEWFSHRGQGAHTGRFGAMIAIAGDGVIE